MPDLELALRTRLRIQGRVFSSAGPVAGAQIEAFASAPGATFGGADNTVSGPAGEFSLKLNAGVEAAHLNILAPGYATRMLRLPLGQASIFEIPLEAPPSEQCSRGALAPLGELVLSLPVPPQAAAPEAASP